MSSINTYSSGSAPLSPLAGALAPAQLCVAPMMALTDRHCRFLHRQLAPHALLFTEMVTSSAVLRGPTARLLADHPDAAPTALQLGGSDPQDLAHAARLASKAGFAEINLNVGCPSDRVRQGAFGAGLMREPDLVAECVHAMRASQTRPVTVKCRIGVDAQESFEFLLTFCEKVIAAGASRIYVHARKAILGTLSPAQNRQIPPLNYPRVHALAQAIAPVPVVINGGITDFETAMTQQQQLAGVMLGRAAFHNPRLLTEISRGLGHLPAGLDLFQHSMGCFENYLEYAEEEIAKGTSMSQLIKPLLGLFGGYPGARRYRQLLSDNKLQKQRDSKLFTQALACINAQAA